VASVKVPSPSFRNSRFPPSESDHAVEIDVAPRDAVARAPGHRGERDAGVGGDLREHPAVVPVEPVLARLPEVVRGESVARHVEVDVAVAVVVGRRDAVPRVRLRDTPGRRAVGEGAVAVVHEEPVDAGPAARHEEVGPAVAIEVADADPAHDPLVEAGNGERVRRVDEAREPRRRGGVGQRDLPEDRGRNGQPHRA
jgi:hypothetical protein